MADSVTPTSYSQKRAIEYLKMREKLERPWKEFVTIRTEQEAQMITENLSMPMSIKLDGSKALIAAKNQAIRSSNDSHSKKNLQALV